MDWNLVQLPKIVLDEDTLSEEQKERYKDSGIYTNSELSGKDIDKYCDLDINEKKYLIRILIN